MRSEIGRYLKNRGVLDHVEFLDHTPHLEPKHIMGRSHVIVLVNIQDGLSQVKTQACVYPVIGTYHMWAGDFFTEGKEGFIVPIQDFRAIAEKLQLLAYDPTRRVAMS